jgi:hypothetical protein
VDLVSAELPAKTLVVAIDPGKAKHRVILVTGEKGLIGAPVSLSTQREGIDRLLEMIASAAAPETVVAIEATGSLHLSWVAEIEHRLPGSTRLFAPSETHAARAQLGSRRFKDDDRDCAALVSLARQGRGRPAQSGTLDALLDAVRHRRRLIAQRKVARQLLHHQLNALCPGLSAPAGHGRKLGLETPTGQAVLACAVDFAGRAPARYRRVGLTVPTGIRSRTRWIGKRKSLSFEITIAASIFSPRASSRRCEATFTSEVRSPLGAIAPGGFGDVRKCDR